MRLLVKTLFLTFVLFESWSAPSIDGLDRNNILTKDLPKSESDDILLPKKEFGYSLQLGAIMAPLEPESKLATYYSISISKKIDLSFEEPIFVGVGINSKKWSTFELRIPSSTLFNEIDSHSTWGAMAIQYLNFNLGFSSLININDSYLGLYYSPFDLLTIQTYYGLQGIAGALLFNINF